MAEQLSPRVLLVGSSTAAMFDDALAHEGIRTEAASSSVEAIAMKRLFRFTVALIDLPLPDQDGLKLVERFAGDGDCGVMLMTDTDDQTTRIDCLDLGADDYLLRPVAVRELVARLRALHRRLAVVPQRVCEASWVTVDWAQRRLSWTFRKSGGETESLYESV